MRGIALIRSDETEKTMKSQYVIKTAGVALAIVFAFTLGSTVIRAQDNALRKTELLADDTSANTIVGVWEDIGVPSETDCTTGAPVGPLVNVSYTFGEGGTMYEEDTLSLDRNRTTGSGIWKRVAGQHYSYRFFHYTFFPDGTFFAAVRGSSNLVLSKDGNSFSERGSFQLVAEDGTTVLYSGCFEGTSHRLIF
jgi:hypothetical protein